jgi:hypothetical protein
VSNDFLPLVSVQETLSGFTKPWFICGGWALDLFLGKKTREHSDVDIGIFRDDQLILRRYLYDWQWHKIDAEKEVPWPENELLSLPVHELDAKKAKRNLEILLNEGSQK